MAKNRDINELRQTKDAHYTHPTFQGGDFIKPTNKPAKSTREVMLENNNKNSNVTTSNPFEHEEVDQAVNQIVETLQPEIFDAIFEAINNEMSHNFLFQADNYLTEAGEELFEDQWFEFYHENHGRIKHKLLQNLK